MIWYKQGVIGDLSIPMRKGLGRVARLAEQRGEDVFVTSLREANHSLGSLHYDGNAVDIRPLRKTSVAEVLEVLGDKDFDVVNEHNHWHLEYDPK